MSVVALLGLLLAAVILPALAFSGFLLQRTSKAQQDIVATLAEATAGAAAQTVDRQLAGMLTTLRSLGTMTEPLTRANLRQLHEAASLALANTGSYFAVVDQEFNQLINTRVPYGDPLTKPTISDQMARALFTGEPQISDGFLGSVSRNWVFSVVLPWAQPGQEPLLLVMTQNAVTLTETLAMENLRGGWNAVIIDNQGHILASTLMSSDVGKPFQLNAFSDVRKPYQQSVQFEGKQYEIATKASGSSGWRVVIWAETETVLRPMFRTFRLLLFGGLVLIGLSAFAAWILGRQLTKSVKQLSEDAERLGKGREVPARQFPVLELSGVSAALSDAASLRKAAENENRFLMREVAHRSKNQLAVVASLAKQSASTATSVDTFVESFQQRIHGLARSTDLLIAGSIGGVDLSELLQVHVAPFQSGGPESLSHSGPPIRLSSQAAQTLGLVFHELATNASKYGAFADINGRLSVDWDVEGDALRIDWREDAPGAGKSIERRGFGTHLIDRTLGRALGASIERNFGPRGLECTFHIPLSAILQDTPGESGPET